MWSRPPTLGSSDGGALELHHQPVLALALDEVTGVEALLRWHHPALGRLDPEIVVRDHQGHLVGRAMPAPDLLALIDARRAVQGAAGAPGER